MFGGAEKARVVVTKQMSFLKPLESESHEYLRAAGLRFTQARLSSGEPGINITHSVWIIDPKSCLTTGFFTADTSQASSA